MNRQMFGGSVEAGGEGRPMDPSQSFRRPVRRKKSDEANRRAVQWRNSDKSDASEDGVVNNLQV